MDFNKLCNSKLLFVNVHFRHGARGSLFINKEGNDYFGMKWTKRGILTPKGKRQIFLNGIKHRERYYNFLNKEYIEDEIKAYSTDSYRAISSLECYLNGIYYNHDFKDNILSDGITVYPPGNVTEYMKGKSQELGINSIPKDNHIIPINIFQKSEHAFSLHEPGRISDCQTITKIREKNAIKNNFNELEKNFKEKYIDKLNKYFSENNITLKADFNFSYNQIHLLCDTLYSDYTDNRDLTKLNNQINFAEFYNDCNNILSIFQTDYISGDKDMVIMSQSPPMKKLIKWMDQRIELDKNGQSDKIVSGSPRFTIWSGHDSTISTFEMFMKHVFGTKFIFPSFCSTILFELHKNEENNIYEIKYLINDELLLTINYNDFKKKVLEIIWSEEKIEEFCQFSIIKSNEIEKIKIENTKYKKIICVLILIISSSLSYNIYNLFKGRKKIKND
jgi:hypothetical protein